MSGTFKKHVAILRISVTEMPLFSFSGEPIRGPFWKQILDGTKTMTTRRARRYKVESGQIAYLFWKLRIPSASKSIHKIGEAYIVNTRRVASLRQLWDDEEYAKAEGFIDTHEMHRWWLPEIDDLPQGQLTLEMMPLVNRILDQMGPMDIITWQYPLINTTNFISPDGNVSVGNNPPRRDPT